MKKRILLVDDEPDFTRLLRLNLEAAGAYEVWEVHDAAEVLAAARGFRPDAIVLDMLMPAADGGAVAADLANDPLLRHTPFVFLTALVSRPEACPPAFGMGRRTYLPKPVDLRQLLAWIEQNTCAAVP